MILSELEEQGLIVCVTKPSNFCSPCFFVNKPHNPTEPRLVVDYSLVNDIILCPVFPLAAPEVVIRKVHRGKGNWWISDESQGITMFISENGHFLWTVCPQGLSCSGDKFGQLLVIIISKYQKFTHKKIELWKISLCMARPGRSCWSSSTFFSRYQGESSHFISQEISILQSTRFNQVCKNDIVLERIIA